MAKLDRDRKTIEKAIHSYELDIENHDIPPEIQ